MVATATQEGKIMSIKTKPKLKTQAEADVVLHLLAIGCEVDSYVRTLDAFPFEDEQSLAQRRLMHVLSDRFGLGTVYDGLAEMKGKQGYVMQLNQELFDAYDEWANTHQED
jgi:hypothetical protein